jgi:predicted outer membrane protein
VSPVTTRSFLGLLAAATVAACASNGLNYQTSGGDVDLSSYPTVTLPSSEVAILREMSDANIIGHLMEVDSIEVAAADTAIHLTRSDDVIAYAKLMQTVHGADRATEMSIANSAGLTPTIDVAKLRSSHVARSLDSLKIASDLTIDRHYLMSQIQLHEHALAELDMLQGVARRPEIRQHIADMMPVVRDHLARAHALAKSKGIEK